MPKKRQTTQDEGFRAGQVFGSHCPYPQGTQDALQWELGWAEGVLERTRHDRNYCDQARPGRLLELLRYFLRH